MARIARSEHFRILQMVQVEGRKVAEVAALCGCTPANIYAILAKLRREGSPAKTQSASGTPGIQTLQANTGACGPSPAPAPAAPLVSTAHARVDDLFAAPESAVLSRAPAVSLDAGPGVTETERLAEPARATGVLRQGSSLAASDSSGLRAPVASSRSGLAKGAKVSKPGFGLCMRSADGDESISPFSSLEDLLSAVKPILRTAARSAEPIWFSIQKLDLAAIDETD